MDSPIRRPQEILAYRSLRRIIALKPRDLWTIGPSESVLAAVQIMNDKNVGFLAVLQQEAVVGVLSERDCMRHVLLPNKSPATTPVGDVMVSNVITADVSLTFADCLKLMHQHSIRHLLVTDQGKPITVISVRDLLGEAVAHHAKIIAELERERMTLFTSTA